MKPLPIDFAPRSLRRTLAQQASLAGLLTCAGIGLGLLATLGAGLAAYQLAQERATLSALALREQARQRRSAPPVAPPPAMALPAAQAAAINRIILQLNLPWRDVQLAVARATPASVALLSLEPDAGRQRLKIMAEAGSSNAMFAYLRALQQQALFASVTLTRHETNEQDANNPIRLQIEAQWVPQ